MTSAYLFFQRHRRMLALGAASIVLHFLTLHWLGARIGTRPDAPPVVTAQLHLALPAHAPAIEPVPAPTPTPVVRRRPAVTPMPAPEAPSEVASATSTEATQAGPEAPPAGAPSLSEAQSAAGNASGSLAGAGGAPAVPEPAPVPPAAGADSGVPAARAYKVSLPQSAELALDVDRVDANGAVWSGVAVLSWRNSGDKYKLSLEAGLNMLVTRINLLALTSEGIIDENGIAPVSVTEKRRGRSLTATHFDRGAGRITFSASERAYPLPPGTQDKGTLPFQLSGIGRADIGQLSGEIDIFVGEDKTASLFRFVLVGDEELDTKMGRLATRRLSRPPRPGTYSSRLDIWLAPGLGWYPVQIRSTEANGAVTTQTVSSITMIESSGI